MRAAKAEQASMGMLKTDHTTSDCLQDGEIGKKLQGKCLSVISPVSPVKLYCCYAVIIVLTVAVIALSVKPPSESPGPCYAICPRDWIGFGSKCFYFSEDMRNWTFSQTSCTAQEAHLALFDSLEELNFLKRYKGASDHWIGLHRESPELPWRWTDNTKYNNLVLTQGGGECAYLNDSGISSARDYTHKKWICSKSNRYTSRCPDILNPGHRWPSHGHQPAKLTRRIQGKKLQEKCLRLISPVSPIKLYCNYVVIIVLTLVVVALLAALSVKTEKPVISTPGPCYATCPSGWIGFGSKCFYFPEDMRNWTLSQSSCMALGAELARFDNLEELNFLKRYVSSFVCWIGLHRESKQHPWKWTDNTEYNNLVPVEGEEEHAYLTGSGISSSRDYIKRHLVCSKSNRYTSQYSVPSSF